MNTNRKKMIAEIVKEKRTAKGFTQKELSDLTNISVRSIQRIENGEILPRAYTLKTLAKFLGFSIESIQSTQPNAGRVNNRQKIILSIGVSILLVLLAWAFVAQSPRFPETGFESFLLAAFVLALITLALLIIWRTKP